MKLLITGSHSSPIDADWNHFITETRLEYIPRQRHSIASMMKEYDAEGILVINREGPVLHTGQGVLFFHPSMAKCRIAGYRKIGQPDLLVQACDIKPGDSFLDCTLGMGADAIVASYFSQGGKVTGLESEPVLAALMKWGMKNYHSRMAWLDEAIHHIEVVNVNHRDYLAGLPDDSYDIVYFDPMFTRPLLHSQPISVLRPLANHQNLTRESVLEARRVARKRVVMKTRAEENTLDDLGFTRICGSKHNPIHYGVIMADGVGQDGNILTGRVSHA